ncbi:tyrosine-type recombinase/integrase [Rubellicoccus peritrichatus]|uniref:Tyrosine-type recombinase/integrase n=1 Tax=Rubellicoccus peritrichatus TaxID=3080537 RepID=A0AAQ3QWZ3_9BACT|nr:tyrosine-type recombinase/integrase [Puniceicoccus sp. CR14]WOO42360.1 tyrosine-type recombinase/integrase [Puniceicoccus sp. CR14]
MPKTKQADSGTGQFSKVAENLYRYNASGGYYALLKRGGKQIRKSLKTQDRKLAERRLADLRTKVDRIDTQKGKTKVEFMEAAGMWLDVMRSNLKSSSLLRRETSINQLRRHFGHYSIRGITRIVCENWAKTRAPQVAASTFNNERETLISILDYSEREGHILDNPARILKRRRQGKIQLRIPTREQFQSLMKTLRSMDSRYWPAADLVELLAYSGMRKGEANELRWEDIDFDRGQFVVTGGETGTKNHDIRHIPLFPVLSGFLERLQNDYQVWNEEDYVIPVKNAKKAIDTACQKADLPHFNHHSLRHYFVSNAIEKGIDFKVIAQWIGHKDGGILVAQTYGHLRDTHSFEMAKRMDS